MKLLAMATLTLLLTGCASEHWTKRGFTLEQWRQDSASCRLVAMGVPIGQPGARIGGIGQPLMDTSATLRDLSRQAQAEDLCLVAKGYYRIPAP